MKKILFVLTLIITTAAFSQNSNSVELEKQKLKQALIYGDQGVATSVMYNIIALQGETSVYKDSLAYLYFNRQSYLSCYLSATDALKNKPNNVEILEMSAFSLESLGAKEKAIEGYQALLAKTNDNFHAYKVAVLQLELKKFDEAEASIKKADQLPDDGKSTITFPINQKYNQSVDLKASISYIEGIIALNLNKEAEAKASFAKAVQLFPEFILAKERLEDLNNPKSEE